MPWSQRWRRMVCYLLWEKWYFFPPSLIDTAFSEATFKDLKGLVLLTFSVQEPKVDGQEEKTSLHLFSKICTKFLLCLLSPRLRNTFKNGLPNSNTDTQMPTAFLKNCMAGNQNQVKLGERWAKYFEHLEDILKYLLFCATHEKSVQAQAALAHPMDVIASPSQVTKPPRTELTKSLQTRHPLQLATLVWMASTVYSPLVMHAPACFRPEQSPSWSLDQCGAGNKSNKTSLIRKKTDPWEKYSWPMFWNEACTEKGQRKSPAMENSLWCVLLLSCKHELGALHAFTAGLHHNSRPNGSQSLKKMSPRSSLSPLGDH